MGRPPYPPAVCPAACGRDRQRRGGLPGGPGLTLADLRLPWEAGLSVAPASLAGYENQAIMSVKHGHAEHV